MSNEKNSTTSMVLPSDLLDQVKEMAKRDLRSISKEFVYLCRKGIQAENAR